MIPKSGYLLPMRGRGASGLSGTTLGLALVLPAALLAAEGPAPAAEADATEEAAAAQLVGTTPPEWQASEWMNSPPLRLAELRGKVVVVRWWTAGCPYCSASAPALRLLDKSYRARGVTVVGMYHHKEDTPFEPAVYRATGKKYGFNFPLAFDRDWRTLKSWLRGANTGFTSVTFVLDQRGVVRHVHPGGDIVTGTPSYHKIQRVIDGLLAPKPAQH